MDTYLFVTVFNEIRIASLFLYPVGLEHFLEREVGPTGATIHSAGSNRYFLTSHQTLR